jgi:hypothetical protein
MATKTTDTVPELKHPRDLIAVDPGNKVSAWVVFRPWKDNEPRLDAPFQVISFGRTENQRLRGYLRRHRPEHRKKHLLITEMLRARGMPTANEEFETCVQIGMLRMLWLPGPWSYAFRGDIKLCLCGVSRANDSNVRSALIELWGGKEKAMGGKKCPACKGKGWVGVGRPTCTDCSGSGWYIRPGPLKGMAEDEWAALAVAYWWWHEGEVQHEIPPPKSKKNKKKSSKKAKQSVTAKRRKRNG